MCVCVCVHISSILCEICYFMNNPDGSKFSLFIQQITKRSLVNIWVTYHSALSLVILNNTDRYPVTVSNKYPFKPPILISYRNRPTLIETLHYEPFNTLYIYFIQDPDLFKVFSSSPPPLLLLFLFFFLDIWSDNITIASFRMIAHADLSSAFFLHFLTPIAPRSFSKYSNHLCFCVLCFLCDIRYSLLLSFPHLS